MTVTIARTVEDALAALAAGARPIAGGSDLVVGARHGSASLPDRLVAIDRVPELALIETTERELVIGAAVTHARLESDASVVAGATAVADAAALVGSPATRNVGTLGGNIMNASPAMDTGAPLVALDARVELRSTRGSREIAIADLWAGPGETTAAADELCIRVIIPRRSQPSASAYVRLEYRRAMEIAVVGAAAAIELAEDGTVAAARIALTAVAPTIAIVRSIDAVGRPVDGSLLDEVALAAAREARPIADLRASDTYRRHTVGVMARRAFDAAVRRARGETIDVPVNRSTGIGATA